MRLNNLKIYCQTEEDQSEMFDFLFMSIRMTSSIVPGAQTETLGHGECSLMISPLSYSIRLLSFLRGNLMDSRRRSGNVIG